MAELFQESWQPDRPILLQQAGRFIGSWLAWLPTSALWDLVVHFSKQFKMKDLFIHRLAPQHLAGLDDELSCVDIKLGHVCRGLHFADKFVHLLQQWCGRSG